MTEAAIEKEKCSNCGVDVRENTVFCYNCGSPVLDTEGTEPSERKVALDPDADQKAALDELAKKFRIDEEEDDRLAKAAAERRKLRVSNRKMVEYRWEPVDDSSGIWLMLLAIVVAAVAGIIVFLAVFWR